MRLLSSFAVLVLLAGCPPPPPVEEPDAGFPDAGTLGVVGDECFSPTLTNDCEPGLKCGLLVDAAEGTFACAAPALLGEACFFNNAEVEVAPADDVCGTGLICGGADTCVPPGIIGAPCSSPADCDSLNCGSLLDGSGDVCVVNECTAGCPLGSVCRQAGRCGFTCVTAPVAGEACVISGADVCSPVRLTCEEPLECFVGDAENASCAVAGGEGSGCNVTTPDDGCSPEFRCDGTGRCVDRTAGRD